MQDSRLNLGVSCKISWRQEASGHDFSRAAKWSKQTSALAAEELQDLEEQNAGAKQAAKKLGTSD
jgi:hypothetical protein